MTQKIYEFGDVATLDAAFTASGVATDPTTVTVTTKKPDGTRTTYTVGTGVTHTGLGAYTIDIPVDQSGQWAWKFAATGAVVDVSTGIFWVNEDPTADNSSLYVTTDQVKETAQLSDVDYANADLTRAIRAACRAIDNYTNRRYYTTATDESRFYTPAHPSFVIIDDMCVFTSLQTDQNFDGIFEETWVLPDPNAIENQVGDFLLTPLNSDLDRRPWTRLELVITWRLNKLFPAWSRNSVKLTGKFGYGSVPAEIQDAAVILATKLVKREREAPFGVVMSALDTGVSARIIRSDPDIQFLLGPYMRELPT